MTSSRQDSCTHPSADALPGLSVMTLRFAFDGQPMFASC
jgi:hypothetical protein